VIAALFAKGADTGCNVVRDVAEVELYPTSATMPVALPPTISEVDIRSNFAIACNVARNVASCVLTLSCLRISLARENRTSE
jgi:hypothetical protein